MAAKVRNCKDSGSCYCQCSKCRHATWDRYKHCDKHEGGCHDQCRRN